MTLPLVLEAELAAQLPGFAEENTCAMAVHHGVMNSAGIATALKGYRIL